MGSFRKKPVVIEAMQWDGTVEGAWRVLGWAASPQVGIGSSSMDSKNGVTAIHDLRILTLEGVMQVSPHDWIIRGVKGEYYPCKPDVFEATYEAVEA